MIGFVVQGHIYCSLFYWIIVDEGDCDQVCWSIDLPINPDSPYLFPLTRISKERCFITLIWFPSGFHQSPPPKTHFLFFTMSWFSINQQCPVKHKADRLRKTNTLWVQIQCGLSRRAKPCLAFLLLLRLWNKRIHLKYFLYCHLKAQYANVEINKITVWEPEDSKHMKPFDLLKYS